VLLGALRAAHTAGAWVFDRSGPLAPALARLGNPLHDRLFPHWFFVHCLNPFPLDGFRLHHEGRPSYHMQLMAMGMHDRDVVRLLERAIAPGATILDVGAHVGHFSLLSAKLAGPTGRVWAFEPNPRLFRLLLKNVEENGFGGRILADPHAVAGLTGTAQLYVNPSESMLSSLCSDAARDGSVAVRAAEVPCTTLDDWAAEHGWPRVDVVKIDVEGLEAAVLRGMTELARHNPELRLIVELNMRTLAAAGVTVNDFWAALHACGLDTTFISNAAGLRAVEFPRDLPVIQREIRRLGNDRVNLLCARTSEVPAYAG
jgi:FkbM family methyltransferase